MILWLLIGALCALLTHWVFRHTYDGWSYSNGNIVYTHRIELPRWVFIAIWVFLPLYGAMSILITPAIISGYWRKNWIFHYNNKLIDWLNEEI